MKVMTVVGTRPEIIRLSRIIPRLDEYFDHTVVHTGQNWDRQLNDVFFEELGLRRPDRHLAVDVSSLGRVIGDVLAKIEPIIREVRPDAFVVLGDTNSCLAAIIAKRLGVPVFHLEAGNRCYDENVPEETNRRLIDHIADFNLCYTEHARRNCLAEGLHPRRVFVVGSPMREVLDTYASSIEANDVLARHGLSRGDYLLVSMHREENVDNQAKLTTLLEGIERVQKGLGLRALVSTHPRLRDRLERLGSDANTSTLELCEPFGYFDYVTLQKNAYCVLSDSGTVSEESAMLGFPAVTIRNSLERPESLDAGSIILAGLAPPSIERAVKIAVAEWRSGYRPCPPPEYQVADCSNRVVRLISGLAGVHQVWSNLDTKLLGLAVDACDRVDDSLESN